MPQSTIGHVFISYSRRDDAVMRRIVKHLRAEGIKVWVDNEKLTPGTPIWEREIEKAIKGVSAAVVILSPDAKESVWVLNELTLVDEYQKRVFPVLVRGDFRESVPFRLATRQFVDLRNNETHGLNSLSTALLLYLEQLTRLEEEHKHSEKIAHDAKEESDQISQKKAKEEQKANKIADYLADQEDLVNRPARQILDYEAKEKKTHSKTENGIFSKKAEKESSTKGITFIDQVTHKFRNLSKPILLGIGGLIIVTIIIWGTLSQLKQPTQDSQSQFNTIVAETYSAQQTTTASILPSSASQTAEPEKTNIPEATKQPVPTLEPSDISFIDDGTRFSGISIVDLKSTVDWSRVKNSGVDFVFVIATEGTSYTNEQFEDYWSSTRSVGLPRGAVHFFRANENPTNQAELFIETVQNTGDWGEFPPALILETNDGEGKDVIIAGAKVWLDLVEQAFGKKPIIYSGQYFLQDYFSEEGGGPPVWANDYPLWYAQYPNKYVDGQQPFLPRGWLNWTFWQYTIKASVEGIETEVDVSVFNGSLSDIQLFIGAP